MTVAPGDVPVALLPIGVETRFRGDTLLVRIVPDEIHVEDHETGLTQAEVEVGQAFWRQVWTTAADAPAAGDEEAPAWAALVRAVGNSRRAAWIADRTEPTGGARPGTPEFGQPELRDRPWTQPAVARTLPDRFVAIPYRRVGSGGQVRYEPLTDPVLGPPVADVVQLGFDPSAPAPEVGDDGPVLPEGMRWLIDTDAAEQAGLLLRIPLPAGTGRVDRLVVLGVLGGLDPDTGSARLADLLSGHHYVDGLALVPVGTPSNNTATDASGWSRADDPVASFSVERRTPAPPEGTDGAALAAALGVPAATLRGIAHSGDAELAAAGRANALVWPVSWGYWLETLAQPGLADADVSALRAHAVRHVRGRGPLPALRIGRQPYGVLPVTSLRGWKPWTEPPAVVRATQLIERALPWWADGVDRAPVVRPGAAPDAATLDLLGQSPVSASVAVRSMLGANACFIPHPAYFQGDSPAEEAARQRWEALLALRALAIDGVPYISQLVAQTTAVARLYLPYTVDPTRPPVERAQAWAAIVAYLMALRGRRTADLQAEDPHGFTSLLTLLARRAVLLERVRCGVTDTIGPVAGTLVEPHVLVDEPVVTEARLISTTATVRIGDTRSSAGAVLAASVTAADGGQVAMTDYLDRQLVVDLPGLTGRPDYAETLDAAEALAQLPPDRVALLLGESLDIASHRIDAWVTSLATARLADLRAARPTGLTLGAYGVVEDLERRPDRPPVADPQGAPAPLSLDTSGAGFVHAPSAAQATTAAVLRAGHLAHTAGDPAAAALAVDLSSSRVRLALGLLEGVRQGQSLGALLGYRVERMLHDLGAHTAVEVVRRLAPPPSVTGPGTPEGLPPTAVCDGLALSRLDRATVLAAVDAADRDAATTVLGTLDDLADAVADLLLAEGVHQIVRGNPDRAAGALDTLNRGEGATAEPEVVRTPRTGTSITHRVALLLARDLGPAPGWPTDGVRAQVEPRLAAWAGGLLGEPGDAAVVVNDAGTTHRFTLAELGVGALDLVYESLANRALRAARLAGAGETATVDADDRAIAALLAVADGLHDLLTKTRAGTGADLARPQDRASSVKGPQPEGTGGTPTPVADVDGGQRRARLDAARGRLGAAVAALAGIDPDGPPPAEGPLQDALVTLAGFGLTPGHDPARAPSAADLAALREAGQERLTASLAAPDDAAALLGEGQPVPALVTAPDGVDLAGALAAQPATEDDVLTWLETYGRVRTPVGRLADVLLEARVRTRPTPARALQLPVEPFPSAAPADRGRWVGLPFPAPDGAGDAGAGPAPESALGADPVTSIVALTAGDPDPAQGVEVLVVDEFVETVPSALTTTAASFGFDAPGARPPQSVLLAVPPAPGAAWTVQSLAAVVGEAVDLAKIRMVDLSSVAWAGRLLPATLLTDGDIAGGLDLPFREIVTRAYEHALAVQP